MRKYVYRSLALHAALVLLIVASSYISFRSFRLHEEKITWVDLPKGSLNELGSPLKKSEGLPQTTIQEQKKAMETPPAGEKKPEMTYQSKAKKQKLPKKPAKVDSASSRMNDALSRMQKQAKKPAQPEAAQIPETRPGGFTFGSSTGAYVSPTDPEYVLYQAKIRQRIMNEWIIPLKFTEQPVGLVCKIVVHINDQGEVVAKEWEQQSGNPAFDMSAMRAVEKASPLDIPPDRLKYEVLNEGFIVEFKPIPQNQ